MPSFRAALTDNGICDVINGNAMKATLRPQASVDELSSALDPRTSPVTPEIIEGTGNSYQRTFWLFIGDQSLINGVPTMRRLPPMGVS